MSQVTNATTDRIEKQVVLRAPRERVWRAIADAEEFGRWFGCRFEGQFAPGARLPGKMVDPPGYEHLDWEVLVERVEPESLLAFRWHPGADPVPSDPMTLVTFTLEEVPEGTRLTVVESGFDALPAERRARAFTDNEGGWIEQMERVKRYVEAG